jgi:hypothetical protein
MTPQDWQLVLIALWWTWVASVFVTGLWSQYRYLFVPRAPKLPAMTPPPEAPTHVQLPDGSWLKHEKTAKWVPSEDPTPPPAPTVRTHH